MIVMRIKKMLLIVGLIVVASTACKSKQTDTGQEKSAEPVASESWSESSDRVTCPVCGLSFPKKEAVASETYKGKQYYFYLEDHHKTFKESPETYISPAQ